MKNVIIVKKALLILNVEGFSKKPLFYQGLTPFNIHSRKDVLHRE